MPPVRSSATTVLFTDLYELTMAASYHRNGLNHNATFDLFVRSLPERRNFLVACGQEAALSYLESLAFTEDDIGYLASLDMFRDDFLEFLRGLRFTGEVRAVGEGEVVFGNEPILEVTAPLIEAQLVETFLLNAVASQTMVASKAARVTLACAGRPFVDFSARRDHGQDAAIGAARAAVIAGAMGTSLVEAGRRFGLRLSGTMAHAYVMSFADEREAFVTFARDFPGAAVLLIDTYDTLDGARHAAEAARQLHEEGITVRGVRLDSGDLDHLARSVRKILDDAGCPDVQIIASGDLDEDRVAELVGAGVPIDAFGVGTRLGTSEDAPSLGAVYKLVADVNGPKMKLSQGKVTLPGRKQLWRGGADVLALEDERIGEEDARPLLSTVMHGGMRLVEPEPIDVMAERCRHAVEALPEHVRALEPASPPYDVRLSPGLSALMGRLSEEHA